MPVVKEWAYTRVPSKDPALVPLYRPPPKVDKKFNTAAYPVNTDNIMLRSAGHKPSVWVMRDISLNRQRQEKQDYYNAKEPAYKDFRWMHGNCRLLLYMLRDQGNQWMYEPRAPQPSVFSPGQNYC